MNRTSISVDIHVKSDTSFDAVWLDVGRAGCASLHVNDDVSIYLHDLDEADQLHAAVLKAKRLIITNDKSQQGRGLAVFPELRAHKEAP